MVISFKQWLLESSIEFNKKSDADGYHSHVAYKHGAIVEIKHYVQPLTGNYSRMNTSFNVYGADKGNAKQQEFIYHAVKQSVNGMLDDHGVKEVTWSPASPKHHEVYTRFFNSKGAEVLDTEPGKHKAVLK